MNSDVGISTIGWVILVPIMVSVGILVYFLPFIIALKRGHPRAEAILIISLTLGWLILSWLVVLVWALRGSGQHHAARRD